VSSAYFINSLGKHNDYKVDLLTFKKELEKFPLVVSITQPDYPAYLLWWELHRGEYSTMAGLQSDQQTITVERNYSAIAALAVWYRTLVPEAIKLFIFKAHTFDTPFELTPDITEEDVVKALIQMDSGS
jgi:hypothetical protein